MVAILDIETDRDKALRLSKKLYSTLMSFAHETRKEIIIASSLFFIAEVFSHCPSRHQLIEILDQFKKETIIKWDMKRGIVRDE